MASVRVRKDSDLLFIDFRFEGKRYRKMTTLIDNRMNRSQVEMMANNIDKQIKQGIFNLEKTLAIESNVEPIKNHEVSPTVSVPCFDDFANEWLAENSFRWKTSGKINVKNMLDRHIIPHFCGLRVDRITKGDVLKFRAQLAEKKGRSSSCLSPKRINNIMQPLKSILDEAAERFAFQPVFQHIKALRIGKPDIQPFTIQEVKLIFDTVRKDYHDYFVVRFFTGMRSGEIHGLRWKNVDFNNNLIYVVESFTYGELTSTKTTESKRDIKMSRMVKDALISQQKATGQMSEFVFCNREGNPLDTVNVANRVWYPLLRHLGLDKRRPYQTRHTAASLWLSAGENPEWVARQLGHSSTQMLFNVYSRYIPNATRNDGSAFESLIRRHTPSNNEINFKEDQS